MKPTITWQVLKQEFIKYFDFIQETVNNLHSKYETVVFKIDESEFVFDKMLLWRDKYPEIESNDFAQILMDSLPESNRKAVRACSKQGEVAFYTCVSLGLNPYILE